MIFAPFAVAKIGEIAERHPDLRVIVDHMGLNTQWKGKDLAPASMSCSNSLASRTSASKFPVCPATSTKPIRFPLFIGKFAGSSTPSARNGFFGAPIFPNHLALIAAPSHFYRGTRFSLGEKGMDHGPRPRPMAQLAAGKSAVRRSLEATIPAH